MSDESIVKEKIQYLQERIGAPFPIFCASAEELLWISGDRFNNVAISTLVSHIMIHLKVSFVKFKINLHFVDETNRPGEYSTKGGPSINLQLARDYTSEQIIAIVCHECTHHFLLSQGIRLENEHENEVLTDIAAIYLGFGNYITEGYKTIQKEVEYKFNRRIIRTSKIGYISEHQIKIAINEVERITTGKKTIFESIKEPQQKYVNTKQAKSAAEKEALRNNALSDCDILKMLCDNNKLLVNQICSNANAQFSQQEYYLFQENIRNNEIEFYFKKYETFKLRVNDIETKADYKQFHSEINKLCTEITLVNSMWGKYL